MLMALLRETMKDIKDWAVRRKIVARLREHIHCLPYEQRAVFWKCYYQLFDYLRLNGQVQREPGKFDSDVKENIKEILKELL